MMEIGTRVRITRDEYPQLVGVTGTVTRVSPDGTAVLVETAKKGHTRGAAGVWCAVSHLEEVE